MTNLNVAGGKFPRLLRSDPIVNSDADRDSIGDRTTPVTRPPSSFLACHSQVQFHVYPKDGQEAISKILLTCVNSSDKCEQVLYLNTSTVLNALSKYHRNPIISSLVSPERYGRVYLIFVSHCRMMHHSRSTTQTKYHF